jgi:hypothetical protein
MREMGLEFLCETVFRAKVRPGGDLDLTPVVGAVLLSL